jgi:hypothetical protein
MAGTVTVTGTAGPGLTVTATVINNVTRFDINMETNILTIYATGAQPNPQFFSITAAGTITATKSGSTYTVTIS